MKIDTVAAAWASLENALRPAFHNDALRVMRLCYYSGYAACLVKVVEGSMAIHESPSPPEAYAAVDLTLVKALKQEIAAGAMLDPLDVIDQLRH